MDSFEEFIIANEKADTSRLLLSCKEWPEPSDTSVPSSGISAKDLAVNTIEARRKLERKVPEWHAATGLVYPTTLCAEQCSSSETARYKASVLQQALSFLQTDSISAKQSGITAVADLTGGLGVDSWAFSSVAKKVLYNEMNPSLAAAARHNFALLGRNNISVSSAEVQPGTVRDILGDFQPDIIFLDPARRAKDGKKVFLLEDCQPDVLKLIPELFSASRFIMLKLSPMADITMAVDRLNTAAAATEGGYAASRGRCIREVHVVAWGGECKELLILMDRNYEGRHSLICCEDGNVMRFEGSQAKTALPDSTYMEILFEPGKSLTKAGVFNEICSKFSLVKLARFTHLYTAKESASKEETDSMISELKRFGKVFTVSEVLPLSKASIKDISKRFPHSEVSARNIPLSSDELRSRLKVTSGNDAHIFGVKIETDYSSGNYLIVCRREA